MKSRLGDRRSTEKRPQTCPNPDTSWTWRTKLWKSCQNLWDFLTKEWRALASEILLPSMLLYDASFCFRTNFRRCHALPSFVTSLLASPFKQDHASNPICPRSAVITSYAACRSKSSISGRNQDHQAAGRLEFLMSGTIDLRHSRMLAAECLGAISAVCLTMPLFDFSPRTSTVKLYRKMPTRSIMSECSS